LHIIPFNACIFGRFRAARALTITTMEGGGSMRINPVAVLVVVAGLAAASPALALNSGSGNANVSGTFSGTVSGNSNSGSFDGTVSNGSTSSQVAGTFTNGASGALSASEPLSGLLVGLGLVGARFLRRR
jgi:hypothetical protein